MGAIAILLIIFFAFKFLRNNAALLCMLALLPVLVFQSFGFDKGVSVALTAVLWVAVGVVLNGEKA